MSIPGQQAWLESAQGRYILDWEQERIDAALADIFGFNAVQICLPQRDFLRASRMPQHIHAAAFGNANVLCRPDALPFAGQSTDLVVLPHVLEFADDPHQVLREVERILIPEGQVVITGFNPLSLWGLRQTLGRRREFPWNGNYLSVPRLKDWLRLLGFEVDRGLLGCYVLPTDKARPRRRWRMMAATAGHWWDFAGSVYVLRAVKRVPGMRLITPDWRNKPARAKALRPIAQKEGHGH